jgi:biotin carboxylase
MIKAIGGGAARHARRARCSRTARAYARCVSEAHAFGVDGVYVERLMPNAAIEVQVLGDGMQAMSLASVNVRCSGASRSWSRSPPARACPNPCAGRSPRPR